MSDSTIASAFILDFRTRHRRGLLVLLLYVTGLLVARTALAVQRIEVTFARADHFAFVVLVPMTAVFVYLLAVFTYGLSGDLAGRRSLYPARMFALPASTTELVRWPMVLGAASMVLLWTATRALAPWPSRMVVPLVWPGLLAVALLGWTQASSWRPYSRRGFRMLATLTCLTALDTGVLLALHYRVAEWKMLAVLLPLPPLAFLAARRFVHAARHDHAGAVDERAAATSMDVAPPFRSAAHAQAWLEWRRYGHTLPVWVAVVVPCELLLLFGAGSTPRLVRVVVILVLFTPAILAALSASSFASSAAVTPFVATRPMTNTSLTAARLGMTVRSTLLSWLVVLVVTPIALEASGTTPAMTAAWREAITMMGVPRAAVFLALVLLAFMLLSWRQLVQSSLIGLTGRSAIAKAYVLVVLALLTLAGPVLDWVAGLSRVFAWVWDAAPVILFSLAALKLGASIISAWHLAGEAPSVAWRGAIVWSAAVVGVYATLSWGMGTEFFPHSLLMLCAILLVPFSRAAFSPVALSWSRHK